MQFWPRKQQRPLLDEVLVKLLLRPGGEEDPVLKTLQLPAQTILPLHPVKGHEPTLMRLLAACVRDPGYTQCHMSSDQKRLKAAKRIYQLSQSTA